MQANQSQDIEQLAKSMDHHQMFLKVWTILSL